MFKITDNHSEKPISGPHPHYESNLAYSLQFCKKTSGKLPNGMEVKICDSGGQGSSLKASLMILSFNPPRTIKQENFAYPVFLHQNRDSFKGELRYSFNELYAMAKKVPESTWREVHPELFV